MIAIVHGVSPRDRWMCVLPGWQMHVNVNVNGGVAKTSYLLNTELVLTPCAQHGLSKSVLSKSVLSTWGKVSTRT